MAIREGRWDCPSCGTRGLMGRALECGSCGAPRPQGIRFYLPGSEPAVTDPALLARARAGADWVCEHCGASSQAARAACSSCGAPRGESSTQPVRIHPAAQVPHTSEDAERAAADRAAGQERRGASASPPSVRAPADYDPPERSEVRSRARAALGGLAVLGVSLVLLVTTCQHRQADSYRFATTAGDTQQTRVVVNGLSWIREVQVERWARVTELGEQVPAGAEPLGRKQVVVGHRRVRDTSTSESTERVQTGTEEYVCGQRDLGNGFYADETCTRPVYETRTVEDTDYGYHDEPVYAERYQYRLWKWVPDTTLSATSVNAPPPPWPAVREGRGVRVTRQETRRVSASGTVTPSSYDMDADSLLFAQLQPGDTVTATLLGGTMIRIRPPRGAPPPRDSARAGTPPGSGG